MSQQNPPTSKRNTYLAVFGILAVLILVTVGVAYLDMSRPMAIGVALLVAAIKVFLIVSVFMHMKFEGKLIRWLMIFAVFFVLVLLFLVLPDIGWACTVCFGGDGGALAKGFSWGIILLLVLPVLIFGLIAFKVFRATRKKNEISHSSKPEVQHPTATV